MEKAAAEIASFAQGLLDSLTSDSDDIYVDVRMMGGFTALIKDQQVDLEIDVGLFGYTNWWDLNFCIPINSACINRIVDYIWNFLKCSFSCCDMGFGIPRRNLLGGNFDPTREFYPLSHAHQEIQTLTINNAPQIVTAAELQKCKSGLLHGSLISSIQSTEDMLALMSSHSQRPFYMYGRDGKKKLFMYSPGCHAHFMVGAVTTIVTDGKAYFTVGIHPAENPAFDQNILEKYHWTHLGENDLLFTAAYDFVDIFVENDPMVHAAFTHNPAPNSKPYDPSHDILSDIKEFEHYMTSETKSIFEDYTTSRRHLSMKPYCESASAFIQQEIEKEFRTQDGWSVCVRNNEYMIYDGDNDDYLPTCVGAGKIGSDCDDSLLVCTLNDGGKMDSKKKQLTTLLQAIHDGAQHEHADCPRVKTDCDFDFMTTSLSTELQDLGWTSEETGTLCKWNNEYVIWDDGVQKTCVVDTANCDAQTQICAQPDHVVQLVHLARNHALKCPSNENSDCPAQFEDAINSACSVPGTRCSYNHYCCPMCEGHNFAKCGYLHEAICKNNEWRMEELDNPPCINANCEPRETCPLSLLYKKLIPLVPEACNADDIFPTGVRFLLLRNCQNIVT